MELMNAYWNVANLLIQMIKIFVWSVIKAVIKVIV